MRNGFSLVEVLVSVLVLALGVIGAAGMQLTALRTAQQSAFQTVALELAAEIADKMRSNGPALRDAGAHPFVGVDYRTAAALQAPPTLCHGAAANCDAAQLANFDLYEWQQHLKAALPTARAVICRDAMPWKGRDGGYKWECDQSAAAPLVIKIGWQGKNADGSLARNGDGQFPPGVALVVEPYAR